MKLVPDATAMEKILEIMGPELEVKITSSALNRAMTSRIKSIENSELGVEFRKSMEAEFQKQLNSTWGKLVPNHSWGNSSHTLQLNDRIRQEIRSAAAAEASKMEASIEPLIAAEAKKMNDRVEKFAQDFMERHAAGIEDLINKRITKLFLDKTQAAFAEALKNLQGADA